MAVMLVLSVILNLGMKLCNQQVVTEIVEETYFINFTCLLVTVLLHLQPRKRKIKQKNKIKQFSTIKKVKQHIWANISCVNYF